MKNIARFATLTLLISTMIINSSKLYAAGPGSGNALIPYSGQLELDGLASNGNFDFRFGLYDAADADTSSLTSSNPQNTLWWDEVTLAVSGGAFSCSLGQNKALNETVFLNNSIYIAIAIRRAGTQDFKLLQGLQRLAQVPYAVRVERADGLLIKSNDSTWKFSENDLIINGTRGGGRALVLSDADTLVLNYSGDFSGGTSIQSDLSVSGSLSVDPIETSTIKIPTNGGSLIITDDDDEVILQVEENASGGHGTVRIKDGSDLEVEGTVKWHCPSDMSRVGTWCIDNDHGSSTTNWDTAVRNCHNAGKDLCPYSALMACDCIGPSSSNCTAATDDNARTMWTRDRHFERDDFNEGWGSNIVCFKGDNTVVECDASEQHEYFCCIPGARL